MTKAGFDGGHLDGLVFHELRHTAAALAIAEGAHPLVIRDRLGHSSIKVTMDVYGGLFPSLDEAIADGLARAFLEAAAAPLRPEAARDMYMCRPQHSIGKPSKLVMRVRFPSPAPFGVLSSKI